MLQDLSHNWWALAIRGIAAIILGILAFMVPALTLKVLVLLFGAYALVDGVFAIVASMYASGQTKRWWTLLIEGILSLAVGAVTLFLPGLTALILIYVIAWWAIITGAFELVTALRLRKEISGEWLMALSGAASIIFGVLLVFYPKSGAKVIIWLIGIYAIVFGALLLMLGFRLRHLDREIAPGETRMA